MLRQRIITAAILAVFFFAALFGLPTAAFAGVCLIALLAAAHEWARLTGMGPGGRRLFIAAVFGLGLALLFLARGSTESGFPTPLLLAVCGGAVLFWIAVAPIWLRSGWPRQGTALMAALGALLILALWLATVELHARSPWLLLATMAFVWIADTAAYFAGRRYGRNKLAPAISPGKTWEGVYGALLATAVYALLSFFVPAVREAIAGSRIGFVLFVLAAVVGAAMMTAISIVGDLFESWIKRQAGVKDSGTLLPGHGGVLDRIDALLPALPLATLFVAMMS